MNDKKPRYWIITASKEHVKEGMSGGFAQACHGKASPLKKMKKGDFVIYYSSKEFFNKPQKCQQFTAIGQVLSEAPYSYEMSADFCPSRLNIEFLETKDLSILPLIESLDFIPNKSKWGYPFRWGTLSISKGDFDTIANLMIIDEGN